MHVVVTGATGRLGQMLKLAWDIGEKPGSQVVWSARRVPDAGYLQWDILMDPAPPVLAGAVVLHLAGVVSGTTDMLAANTDLALKLCDAASAAGAKHVFLASSASVYGAGLADHEEGGPTVPTASYGIAKLLMENKVFARFHHAHTDAPGITCLRIGNVVGADALIGNAVRGQPVLLDPVTGRGPERSYIGPRALAQVLAMLVAKATGGEPLPSILNVAASQAVFMADLLVSARLQFQFGPFNPNTIARVGLSTTRLAGLMMVPAQDPRDLIADWESLYSVQI